MDDVTLPKVPKKLLTGLTTKEAIKMMDVFKGKKQKQKEE